MLFFACATNPWTDEAALAPHRARLDADHDGRVTAAEYEKTLWNGPPFGTADADGDGDLSVAELEVLVRQQSAVHFDGPQGENSVKKGGEGVTLPPPEALQVQEFLVWMIDALAAKGQTTPDPALVQAAIHSQRLDSAESKVVLDQLRPLWLAQGWVWPAGVP